MPRTIDSVPLPVGRRVAFDHVADVGDGIGLAGVAAEVDAAQVEACLVGAADEIGHDADLPVDDERQVRRMPTGPR